MTYKFGSIAEGKAAPKIAALGGKPCSHFSPLLSKFYTDADGIELEGRPDFVMKLGDNEIYIELKDGVLNSHRTQASSTEALRDAYRFHLGKSGDGMTHAELSRALYKSDRKGQMLARENAFNHSLFKLAAMQARYGWLRYMVVFKDTPKPKDAHRYVDAGLVWCTLATLPDMLRSIELLQHGFQIPFYFNRRKISMSVTPDPASCGLTPDEVEASDRAKFLAAAAKHGLSYLEDTQ